MLKKTIFNGKIVNVDNLIYAENPKSLEDIEKSSVEKDIPLKRSIFVTIMR